MDNDSGALILLIVLIVSAFLLIVLKLAQFVNHFSREKQYLLTEMHRAADYNEYRYWRRELRCLYLCLIPFVTERNVMKVYPVFFHRAKHATKEKRSDGLMHILAPSMLAICICAICLCGVSWAWFTASTSTGTTAIQSSSYKLLYQVGEDATATELAEAGTAYTLTSDTTVIGVSDGVMYDLIKRYPIKTEIINNRTQIYIDSFEEWYATQDKYRKVTPEGGTKDV